MISFLNGKTLDDFGARLRSRRVAPATLSAQSAWPMNASTPYISRRYKSYWKKMMLSLELKGSWADIEAKKGALMHQFASGQLQFHDELDKVYGYVLDGDPTLSDQHDGQFETLTVNLLTYKEDLVETAESLSPGESKTITYIDTVLPLRTVLEVTGTGTALVTINGELMTLSNLTGGTRVIGDGRIVEGGTNMWEDTQLPSGAFPELMPGANTVLVTGASLKIRTKRRYL